MPRLRNIPLCRSLLYLAIGLAVCELFILNVMLLYVYASLNTQISGFLSSSEGAPILDKLLNVPALRDMAYDAKNGGFVKMIENTLGRVFLVTPTHSTSRIDSSLSRFESSEISYLSLDVSCDGEALYLIRRMKQRGSDFFQHYQQLVVDIGANDGLLSSNSFNLIQLGWNAILVEPQQTLLHMAKVNIAKHVDPYNESNQKVTLVNAVISSRDGMEDFLLMRADMESHVYRPSQDSGDDQRPQMVVQVPSLTVNTFAAKYHVPKRFAVLSIDAEGVGDTILRQWIDGGFRPAYIVYEWLHIKEPLPETSTYLTDKGYRLMIKLGWNVIYEHEGG